MGRTKLPYLDTPELTSAAMKGPVAGMRWGVSEMEYWRDTSEGSKVGLKEDSSERVSEAWGPPYVSDSSTWITGLFAAARALQSLRSRHPSGGEMTYAATIDCTSPVPMTTASKWDSRSSSCMVGESKRRHGA